MKDINSSRFALHISDFHLMSNSNPSPNKRAEDALKAMTKMLKARGIKIDYIFYTGDIIDSEGIDAKGDIEAKNIAKSRFDAAETLINDFISELNLAPGNVVFCCGNHDALRISGEDKKAKCTVGITKESDSTDCIGNISSMAGDSCGEYKCDFTKDTFELFDSFLDKLNVANSKKRCNQENMVTHCRVDNLSILIINTSWPKPDGMKEGYHCVNCKSVVSAINNIPVSAGTFNVVLAHKPIYEICEKARLSYKRYRKTEFMLAVQKFIGDNGIYLCGDKHTRSIVGAYFHNIPHYIGGEPLTKKDSNEVEYNLIEIKDCRIGMAKKIHLALENGEWKCSLRPQDDVISHLYDLSKGQITINVFRLLGSAKMYDAWESLYQDVYTLNEKIGKIWSKSLDVLFKNICKYRKNGVADVNWSIDFQGNIFDFVLERINERIVENQDANLLNIRGEYGSGKSTFIGLLYLYMMYKYCNGLIDCIPAYFNLENEEIQKKVKGGLPYFNAVKSVFSSFTEQIQSIANKERQNVCYFIDGMDEQDCWSYGSESSAGRAVLDVIELCKDSWYVMSFEQNHLPIFKNTMSERRYADKSDIMYFNQVDIQEYVIRQNIIKESAQKTGKITKNGLAYSRLNAFVEEYIMLESIIDSISMEKNKNDTFEIPIIECDIDKMALSVCKIIQKFRRVSVNMNFLKLHYAYLTEVKAVSTDGATRLLHENALPDEIFKYYIDKQYEICLSNLKYDFVNFAPEMAYLYAYRGYTFERFKKMREDDTLLAKHIKEAICDNASKIDEAFMFIKKNKDARDYLISFHYNKELRYYAENQDKVIPEDSILNEFICRDIAVLIRKGWSDTNKFIIVCEKLLRREKINNCLLSMLIYCLAYQRIYTPLQDKLYYKMRDKAKSIFEAQGISDEKECDISILAGKDGASEWRITETRNDKKLEQFLQLSLLHTIETFDTMDAEDSKALVVKLIKDRDFAKFNRQYQMLYYGDLTIKGENKKHPLIPGEDIIYKGFDFHNCFSHLYEKLNSEEPYALREYDMFTLWDLVATRCSNETTTENSANGSMAKTFFYWEKTKDRGLEVIKYLKDIIDKYINEQKTTDERDDVVEFFKKAAKRLNDLISEATKEKAKEIREKKQNKKESEVKQHKKKKSKRK